MMPPLVFMIMICGSFSAFLTLLLVFGMMHCTSSHSSFTSHGRTSISWIAVSVTAIAVV